MSHRYSSGGGGDSRRYSSSSRRDSPHRHGTSRRRSPSPGPSRHRDEPPKERDPRSLPEAFGRGEGPKAPEDDSNILQRMKSHYLNSPLSDLYDCIKSEKKVKIWTRNFKEVRGVMTGYLIAFDKHWNVVLKDVDEVFLKPKKSKTPFLREIGSNDSFLDIPAKVPRQKKDAAATSTAAEAEKPKAEGEGKKKKTRRKKAKSTSAKRQIPQLFVRGDNIVMVCPFEENAGGDDEEEEEEEMEGEESQDDNRNV